MRYMGSKARILKHILPIMLFERQPDQWWVEPFVGGGNVIENVWGKRLGADINPYVIEALILIRDAPETIPDLITEEDYKKLQEERNVDGLTGIVGFGMSFGSKWFGGYARNKKGMVGDTKNMKTQTRRVKDGAIEQSPKLQGCVFVNKSYLELEIPDNSLIYCDPPYQGVTSYKDTLNHEEFWGWCRDMDEKGHTVFVSEYNAPDDFECIWEKELRVGFIKWNQRMPDPKQISFDNFFGEEWAKQIRESIDRDTGVIYNVEKLFRCRK